MKKLFLIIICLFIITPHAFAEELAHEAKSAVLMEYSTGKILFDKNQFEHLPPASMTKIMTLLLTMEAIDNKKINLEDMVTISPNASSMGGSQMFLEANSLVKVEDLIKGLSVVSANDAAVALAEYISGSVEEFVNMMNKKASDLGLKDTNFVNPHGLDADNHYSCAHDMAVMARELIKHDKILKYTSTYEDYFNKSDGSRTWLVNTNKLIRYYKGVDGLKTGYTKNAMYCLTATASKNDTRYITVVMGEPTSEIRSKETTELLNYAFSTYKLNTIIDKNNDLGKVYVEKGNVDYATLVVLNPVTEVELKNNTSEEYKYNIKANNITAPVKVGDIIGSVEILDKDNLIVREESITVKEDIEKISLIKLYLKNIKVLLVGR